MSETTRKYITDTQKFKMHSLLQDRVIKLPDGTCQYVNRNDGDQAIADAIGIGMQVVKKYRQKNFGKLAGQRASPKRNGKQEPDAAVPAPGFAPKPFKRLAELEGEVKELKRKVDYLWDALGAEAA